MLKCVILHNINCLYHCRYEYQHRGSPHVHGVVWLTGAPSVENLLKETSSAGVIDSAQQVVDYFDTIVSRLLVNL